MENQLNQSFEYHKDDQVEFLAILLQQSTDLEEGLQLLNELLMYGEEGVKALAYIMPDTVNIELQPIIVDTLRHLGNRAIPVLIDDLGNSNTDSSNRRAVAYTLASIGDSSVTDALVSSLGDPSPEVRSAAAVSLARLGNKSVSPSITKLLADQDSSVRVAAIRALARLREAQLVDTFLGFLEHADLYIRNAAAGALGQLGDRRAIPYLLKLLQDPDPVICATAAEALAELQAVEALPLLRAMQQHDTRRSYKASNSQVAADAIRQIQTQDPAPRQTG